MHPATVHYREVDRVWKQRQLVMKEAYDRNPGQFVNGTPQIQKSPRKDGSTSLRMTQIRVWNKAKTLGLNQFTTS